MERDYFKEPFTGEEIREMAALGRAEGPPKTGPSAPLRTGIEQIFARRSPSLKQMGLAGQELSEDEIVGLMLKEPKLVRRPIMRVGGQLFVGGGASLLDSVIAAAA